MTRQPDLFATTTELHSIPTLDQESMAERVRPRLANLLTEARSATAMPWNEQRTRVNALVFYNMANWLPENERDTLRAQFAQELTRLGGVGFDLAGYKISSPADGDKCRHRQD